MILRILLLLLLGISAYLPISSVGLVGNQTPIPQVSFMSSQLLSQLPLRETPHMRLHFRDLIPRIIHLLSDKLIQIVVAKASQLRRSVDIGFLRRPYDTARDYNTHVADACDVGVQPAFAALGIIEGRGERFGGGVNHGLRD